VLGYKVKDAEEAVEMTKNISALIRKLTDKDGNDDIEKHTKLNAFAQDMEAYDASLIKYGMALAEKNRLKTKKNIKPKKSSAAPKPKKGMAATKASLRSAKWES
jgi:DNA-binding protein H-NS